MSQKLLCPKALVPSVFMGEAWSTAEQDERAEQLTEIDIGLVTLVRCSSKNDHEQTGEQWLKLLKETSYVRLGGRAFLAFWEHQVVIPDAWKEPFTFVFFDGAIVSHRNGNRYSLYLSWHNGEWHWYSCWLGNMRSAGNTSAVLLT